MEMHQWVELCNNFILAQSYWFFWSCPTRAEFMIAHDFFRSQQEVETLCKSVAKAKSWEGDLSW